MVARVDREKKEIVFSEPLIGGRGRIRVRRSLHPICLENIDELDFKFLYRISGKRLKIGDALL